MSIVETTVEVEYPESDGLPMGETDIHRMWMNRILDLLRHRYRDQRGYIAANLLVYPEESSPFRFTIPDDFVVFDCDPQTCVPIEPDASGGLESRQLDLVLRLDEHELNRRGESPR